MKKIKNQFGFSGIEAVVIILVLVALAGAGYFVWHKHNDNSKKTSSTSNSSQSKVAEANACTSEDKSVKGELFKDEDGKYSICIPDGWHILAEQTGVSSLMADVTGLHYKAGVKPIIDTTTEGKDGPGAFSLFSNTPSASTSFDHYTDLGKFKAVNSTGEKYTRVQNAQPAGAGALENGTRQYEYIFNSANLGLGVSIDYNIAPNDKNQLTLIDKVVATFHFKE